MSVNKVILVGRLGGDPEIRHTQDGRPIATFSMATSERWKDKSTGERKEKTEWHRVVVFNENLAKIAGDYLKKGSQAYIEGQLASRKWTDKDGVERTSTEVVLSNFRGTIVLLDSKGEGGGRGTPNEDEYGTTRSRDGDAAKQQPLPNSMNDDLDDEIPF